RRKQGRAVGADDLGRREQATLRSDDGVYKGASMRAAHLLALGVLIGCSGSGKPSIGTSKDNFCDQIAAVACYDLYQCCAEGEIERFLGVADPRTSDQCRQDLKRICERRYVNV